MFAYEAYYHYSAGYSLSYKYKPMWTWQHKEVDRHKGIDLKRFAKYQIV